MAKKKKTRKQKFLADLRQNNLPNSESVAEIKLPLQSVSSPLKTSSQPSFRAAIATSSYAYVSGDLLKTFFLTLFIVILELGLHYFLKLG